MSAATPTIVVLGAAFSGLPLTHRLLRDLPAEYKVVLVNPATSLYWNFAAPRVVAKDNQFSAGNADVFRPILPGFAAHGPARFEFVQGKATALDPAANTVVVTTVSDDAAVASTQRSLVYTHLVIATGSSAPGDWAFKPLGSQAVTEAAIKANQVKIAAAKHIVLSGGGATGVETVGEIATLYKGTGKTITILSAADHDGVAETRTVFLENLNSPFGMTLVGNTSSPPHRSPTCRRHWSA